MRDKICKLCNKRKQTYKYSGYKLFITKLAPPPHGNFIGLVTTNVCFSPSYEEIFCFLILLNKKNTNVYDMYMYYIDTYLHKTSDPIRTWKSIFQNMEKHLQEHGRASSRTWKSIFKNMEVHLQEHGSASSRTWKCIFQNMEEQLPCLFRKL